MLINHKMNITCVQLPVEREFYCHFSYQMCVL
jgi:hypothetical protein